MTYAIIRIQGKQYKVSEGDEILVDKLGEEEPKADILLVSDGKNVKVGTPIVRGAKVDLKVIESLEKGKKLHVSTYKAKSRYRRKLGFRPLFTRLKVQKITS